VSILAVYSRYSDPVLDFWKSDLNGKKGKEHIAVNGTAISQLRDVTYHMGSHRLPPDTSERALPQPHPGSWYSMYLPRRDGRLS